MLVECCLTLFRMGLLRAAHRWAGGGRGKKAPLSKICHTYPTIMKLGTVIPYLRRSKKYMNHVTHPLRSTDISIFLPKISKFCYIKKYRYRLQFGTQFLIFLTFIESIRIFLIRLVIILMMSTKMATSGLLKITVFWNKGYDVIIPVDERRHQQNFITWLKLYCRCVHVTKVW